MSGFTNGFSDGFGGNINMATIQTISDGTATALTAITMASGVAQSISGVLTDHELNLVVDLDADGTFTVNAGDYVNGSADLAQTMLSGSIYGITDLDGSKYRQDDGTYEIETNVAGTVYAYTRA